MVKKSVAHPYYGIQLSNTKELTVGMQKLGCIARELFEWGKKPISTGYLPYDIHLYNSLQNDKSKENRLVVAGD